MKLEVYPVGMLSTNCYVLENEIGDVAVVDPGFVSDDLINALNPRLDRIKYILLTHTHADHIMGLVYLLENCDATVVCHSVEKERLENPSGSLYNTLKNYYFAQKEDVKAVFDAKKPKVLAVGEGDEIPFGKASFKVLHTPGHTDGSVCYMAEDFILSGDTLFKESIGRTDFPTSSYEDMEKSLEKIFEIEKDYTVYPGHGESTTLSYEKRNNPFLR